MTCVYIVQSLYKTSIHFSSIILITMILLWGAEGFVQPRGEEEMEDVAKDYIEEFVQRAWLNWRGGSSIEE